MAREFWTAFAQISRTIFAVNGGALPRTGITPIPPLNLTRVSAPTTGKAKKPPMRSIGRKTNKPFS
jgi:hypothetical protein